MEFFECRLPRRGFGGRPRLRFAPTPSIVCRRDPHVQKLNGDFSEDQKTIGLREKHKKE